MFSWVVIAVALAAIAGAMGLLKESIRENRVPVAIEE